MFVLGPGVAGSWSCHFTSEYYILLSEYYILLIKWVSYCPAWPLLKVYDT